MTINVNNFEGIHKGNRYKLRLSVTPTIEDSIISLELRYYNTQKNNYAMEDCVRYAFKNGRYRKALKRCLKSAQREWDINLLNK